MSTAAIGRERATRELLATRKGSPRTGVSGRNPAGCFPVTPCGATPGHSVSRRATRDRADALGHRGARASGSGQGW